MTLGTIVRAAAGLPDEPPPSIEDAKDGGLARVIAAATEGLFTPTPPAPAPNPVLSYRSPPGTTERARQRTAEIVGARVADYDKAKDAKRLEGLAAAVDDCVLAMTPPAQRERVSARLAANAEPQSGLAAAVDAEILAMTPPGRRTAVAPLLATIAQSGELLDASERRTSRAPRQTTGPAVRMVLTKMAVSGLAAAVDEQIEAINNAGWITQIG